MYFQNFCDGACFQSRLPRSPTNLAQFRQTLGGAGVEELLATTIAVVANMKVFIAAEFERVIVDSTGQEKRSCFQPTADCWRWRARRVARAKLVQLAQHAGLLLEQTYEREGGRLRRRAGSYGRAKQYKRLRRVLKRRRTILGRRLRDIGRKLSSTTESHRGAFELWFARAWRICRRRPKEKGKLYALHAPEVECIGKGKAHQPYEFGVRASLAMTEKQGLIVGVCTFAGNLYGGHTLAEYLEQTRILSESVPGEPSSKSVFTDLSYRGVDTVLAPIMLIHRGKCKTLSIRQRRWLKCCWQTILKFVNVGETHAARVPNEGHLAKLFRQRLAMSPTEFRARERNRISKVGAELAYAPQMPQSYGLAR
ncbi:IS5/IS1182 family transposase [Burkholderia ubonensis]|nr:IS5/IS1182 family transposase [Burkholderia ubonensis]